METKTVASEAGHWYAQDGTPVYEVPYADPRKGMRNTTLRDARQRNLFPSVTTINKLLASPGLEKWKQDQLIKACFTTPALCDDYDLYAETMRKEAEEQARRAMELGTEIHGAIEKAYLGQPVAGKYAKYVKATQYAIDVCFGVSMWFHAEKSFSHELGFGGKVDLSNRMYDDGIVIDIKTKEFGENDEVKGWPEQCRQLAAYRVGLGIPTAICANVFVSTNNPGLVRVFRWSEEELDREWQIFKRLVEIWQLKNNHYPKFKQEAA